MRLAQAKTQFYSAFVMALLSWTLVLVSVLTCRLRSLRGVLPVLAFYARAVFFNWPMLVYFVGAVAIFVSFF